MMAKKSNKDKEPVSGLTLNQIIGINNAVTMVEGLKFPMKISYQLSKTKNQIETCIKAHDKAMNALREELRSKVDGNWIIPDKNLKQWRDESEELLDKTEPDLKLRTFDFNDFDFEEDDHYSDTLVPQGFMTLMFPLLTEE